MTVSAEVLQRLHRILRQRTDILSRLERGPKVVAAKQRVVVSAEAERETLKERKTKTRLAADEKQLHMQSREARVSDLEGKLNGCSSNKEYQTLKEQIAADEQANSVLADEIFELLEKIDQIDADIAKAEEAVTVSGDELTKTTERIDLERQSLESDLARVNDELATVEGQLSGDFKVEYERLVRVRGEEALAPLEGECCGGCNQMLAPKTFSNLKLQKPVFCSSCGSLLYLPEGR